MKGSTIGGMITGLALGAATLGAFSMMSRKDQRKVRLFATRAGRMLTEKAGELMGK